MAAYWRVGGKQQQIWKIRIAIALATSVYPSTAASQSIDPEILKHLPAEARSGRFATYDIGSKAQKIVDQMGGALVSLWLTIDERGELNRCVVAESSGAPVIDGAACNMLMSSGTFRPAVIQGKPVTQTIQDRVRFNPKDGWYKQPEPPPLNIPPNLDPIPDAVATFVTVDIDEAGAVIGCSVDRPSGYRELDDRACGEYSKRGNPAPQLDALGRPVAHIRTAFVYWNAARFKNVPPQEGLGFDASAVGKTLPTGAIGVSRLNLVIGHDGRVQSCIAYGFPDRDQLDEAACLLIIRDGRFGIPLDRDGRPTDAELHKTVVWKRPGGPPAAVMSVP